LQGQAVMRGKLLSALSRNEGVAAIEYAFVLPVLMWLIMGTLEYSLVMYASAVLDGAMTAAAREGKTGYVNTTSSLVGYFVGGLLKPSSVSVSYTDTNTSTFNAATDAPTLPSGPCTNNPALANPPSFPLCTETAQTAGDVVVYTATYPWNIMTPFLQNVLGTNGVYTLSSSVVIKNEPYNTGVSR
jgi:Flp pilus assembly protein TadG